MLLRHVTDYTLNKHCFSDGGNTKGGGTFSFGIGEHIDLGVQYDSKIGTFGMNFNVTLMRPGKRISKRRRAKGRVGSIQRVTSEDAIKWFESEFDGYVAHPQRMKKLSEKQIAKMEMAEDKFFVKRGKHIDEKSTTVSVKLLAVKKQKPVAVPEGKPPKTKGTTEAAEEKLDETKSTTKKEPKPKKLGYKDRESKAGKGGSTANEPKKKSGSKDSKKKK